MTGHSTVQPFVAVVAAACALPPGAIAQRRVDVTPYVGRYLATTSLTPAGVLKQAPSFSLGAHMTVWLGSRLGFEGSVNYALSDVMQTAQYPNEPFGGPTSAHVIAASAKVIARLNPPGRPTGFHVGGGLGVVSYGGPAYNPPGDSWVSHYGTTFSGGVLNAGVALKLGPSLALRLDGEDYVFRAHFQCRGKTAGPGVCYAVPFGTPTSKVQQDFVMSVGVSVRVAGH